jgi:hypothetical protein
MQIILEGILLGLSDKVSQKGNPYKVALIGQGADSIRSMVNADFDIKALELYKPYKFLCTYETGRYEKIKSIDGVVVDSEK